MLSLEFMRGLATGCILSLAAVLLGRLRIGRRLDRWAQRTVRRPDVTKTHPLWWATQVVFAAEITWLFATRPRKTLATIRANRDQPKSEPVLVHDPDWAGNRKETP